MPANYQPTDTAEIVKPEFMFNIVSDEAIQRELNGGGPTFQNLRDSFQDNQIALSNNAHVWVESKDRWLITDRPQNFLIRNEHGQLNVYKRPNIDNCTLEYRYFLEINPSHRRPGTNEIDFPRYLHSPDSITVGVLRDRQTNQLNYLAKSCHIFCEFYFYKVDWRLIIGLGGEHVRETNMTLDHIYGIPYLPGSAFKGVVRSWVIQEVFSKEALAMRDANFIRVFGSQELAGKVQFLPAYPIDNVTLSVDIMNPHFPDYYTGTGQPTDVQDPIPINFWTVEQTSFRFVILAQEQVLIDTAKDWVEKTLRDKGLGAKTAVGYGHFQRLYDVQRSFKLDPSFPIPLRTRPQRGKQISLDMAFQQFSNKTMPDPQLVDIALIKNCAGNSWLRLRHEVIILN